MNQSVNRKAITWMRWPLLLAIFLSGSQLGLAAEVDVRNDSPGRYTVVEGDTLWDIAGQFLEEPWLWPQVWEINPQIANPDLIYPGDLIELAYVDGQPVLRLSRGTELQTIRLSPQVRREAILSPIPAISLDSVSAFLSNNAIVGTAEFDRAPYVLGTEDGRILATEGNVLLARGDWSEGLSNYDVIRRGTDFVDPDTKEVIGIEGILVASARVSTRDGDTARLAVEDVFQEIRAGDRLIRRESSSIDSSYMPRPPEFEVDAAIVSIGAGKTLGSTYDTLILNVGSRDGMEPGQILTIKEPELIVNDTFAKPKLFDRLKQVVGLDSGHKVSFPGELVATVLIYRVFEGSSLGLVLASEQPIQMTDRAVTP